MRRTLVWCLVVCLVPALLTFAAGQDPDYTVVQGSGEAEVGGTVAVSTLLDFPNGSAVSGVSYGVCHDPAFVNIDCVGGQPNDCTQNGIISQGAAVAATNGGQGAQFFAPATTSDPSTGYTNGVVINLLGGDSLAPAASAEIAVTMYQLIAEPAGDPPSTPLTVCVTGNPTVLLSVGISGGGDVEPSTADGAINLFVPPPVIPFMRGDCNDDGGINIADGIFFLNTLFQEGPAPGCDPSCDSNADGMGDVSDAIYSITYALLDGLAPPAPFPDCGLEDGQTPEDCLSYNSCP